MEKQIDVDDAFLNRFCEQILRSILQEEGVCCPNMICKSMQSRLMMIDQDRGTNAFEKYASGKCNPVLYLKRNDRDSDYEFSIKCTPALVTQSSTKCNFDFTPVIPKVRKRFLDLKIEEVRKCSFTI